MRIKVFFLNKNKTDVDKTYDCPSYLADIHLADKTFSRHRIQRQVLLTNRYI